MKYYLLLLISAFSFVTPSAMAACAFPVEKAATRIGLDWNAIANLEDLHQQMAKHPSVPDYYGHNLDALFDILVNELPLPLILEFTNYGDRVYSLKPSEQRDFFNLLEDAKEELGDGFCIIEN
jgi:ribonuclease inhibitor